MDRRFIFTIARFHRKDPSIYVVQGYFQGNSIAGSHMSATLDGQELPLEITVREGLTIRQKYFAQGFGSEEIDREYDLWITLPPDCGDAHVLKVWQLLDGQRRCVYRILVRRLLRERKMPDGYLETFRESDGMISVGGWAVGNSACRITVMSRSGRSLTTDITWHYRRDIAENYPELINEDLPEENSYGYEVTFPRPAGRYVRLMVSASGQEQIFRIDLKKGLSGGQRLQKALLYFRRNGFARTVKKAAEKLSERVLRQEEDYMAWYRGQAPTREELEVQRKSEFQDAPLISVVVPLYRTNPVYLREMIASVREQTYGNWELCLSDGSGEVSPLREMLRGAAETDERIRVVSSQKPLGIAENTNAALEMAQGEYLAFLDHDDLLAPEALYECVRRITEEPEADLIYSDEDKVRMDGKVFFQPHFKTDFNIDLLCSMNYICHLAVVSRRLYEQVGALRPEFDGAQDYDFVLRCAEQARRVIHIPKVLYHWRSHTDSTAENPASKTYAFEAGMRAVQAHYDRTGVDAAVSMGEYPGLYRTTYRMPEHPPMISIIIPNRDHGEDLEKCIRSLFLRSRYPSYEIIVVENGSVLPETFALYERLTKEQKAVRVLTWDQRFNYAAINNFGARSARGSYLLFLNNDTELIAEDTLEQLLGPALRPEVGAVGARLFYPDNTIQHAGVIIGYGGIAGHAFQGMAASENGYFSRILCQSDLSAVTAACMLVRRDVFEKAEGFDETLQVAFNDIDLCLKIQQQGYLVVYNPYAMLYHYESKSRGMEDTPEKIARFNREADIFLKKWPEILKNGDPYYNPNLSLDRNDFALKKAARTGHKTGGGQWRWFLLLHGALLIYSATGFFSKNASRYPALSLPFLLYYGGMIGVLGIYALLWQQVIKHLPVTLAYANKAVTVIWGVILGRLLFAERITHLQRAACLVIITGTVLYVLADYREKEGRG